MTRWGSDLIPYTVCLLKNLSVLVSFIPLSSANLLWASVSYLEIKRGWNSWLILKVSSTLNFLSPGISLENHLRARNPLPLRICLCPWPTSIFSMAMLTLGPVGERNMESAGEGHRGPCHRTLGRHGLFRTRQLLSGHRHCQRRGEGSGTDCSCSDRSWHEGI